MTILLGVLIVAGGLLAVAGAVDAYSGRMRTSKGLPGFYDAPKDSPRGLILAIAGALLGVVSGLIALLAP
ncbi:hypothetical protein DZF92_04575 [Clavibacter michiganensis subsp. insidiosus]|uniref:Uncharacterized protein n=1 Tax=Clavibacter michiganensis subsp. insidiosus TaxID=33014 RepID=A0A0D5CHK7_9MICO|nr:hypothetical protein [Clavibacter michiganensis]AJW78732.1 hypothetical protein VO01_05935 [Clavibacter michiganensis subsp. insidiosus]AWG01180.1 hypothetical protein BEH62_06170 [Clavibacter michiganensis subsp. insidiosus]OQJ60260.1 hypothetical protein B5P21_10315 [Clavibacter michiganensis subsp. insidiosus]RII88043.1 hypothetical protein DZF92_04575 [Clavibacter michiganensis subsp. insidiosus]RIJ29932.1 hypothetical protein DZF93_09930 [Clavibacter michiganensis subsp. insidiosus]